MSTPLAFLVTFVVMIPYASLFEYTLHRYVMHRKVRIKIWGFVFVFDYPFHAHAGTHHHDFKADASYHYHGQCDKSKIGMAWWNWMVLVPLCSLPFCIAAIPFMLVSWWMESWTVIGTSAACSFAYYCVYEYSHRCMHDPKVRWFERTRFFLWLNARHLLHHKFQGHNYNVVLPLVDWCFGTYLSRAPNKFVQVRGPSVPDVQPA